METLEIVAGAQYGSEAKGHVTAQIVSQAVQRGHAVINVRVAGPNAGHTVYDAAGRKFAFRQVPVGAVLDDAVLSYIAPGSEVDPPVLFREVAEVRNMGHQGVIALSREATLMDPVLDTAEEARGRLTERLGSTGKGIGSARVRRLQRTAQRVGDNPEFVEAAEAAGILFIEPGDVYGSGWTGNSGDRVTVIEGTQGYGLGLHTEAYPYTTSSDCRAIDFIAMAGVNPWVYDRVLVTLVARMFPIRVAGNSGPLENETTWEALGLPEERTTVTQKVRRVGAWDDSLVARALEANGKTPRGNVRLAISMLDQQFPEDAEASNLEGERAPLSNAAIDWLYALEDRLACEVRLITTSPRTAVWL